MRRILTITDKDITGAERLSATKPRIAVNAVLFDSDENIALSYMGKYDLHTLVGGGVDPGEDLVTAVKREVLEETGCHCEIIGELGQIFENRAEQDFTQERYYFVGRVVGEKGNLCLTDEEIANETTVEWHPLEQALEIISNKQHDNYQRKFIQRRDIAALTEALKWVHLHEIPDYDSFIEIELITKGFSKDRKYCVTKADGTKYLLRVTSTDRHESHRSLFALLEKIAALGVSMCKPVEFGVCGKNVYCLQSWIDGVELREVFPQFSEAEQYSLGVKAGKMLRQIHSIPVLDTNIDFWTVETVRESWEVRFNRELENNINEYKKSGLRFDGDSYVFEYIEKNRHLLKNRPHCFGTDDFNAINMMYSNGELVIIDFERYNIGDPWEEFSDTVWNVMLFKSDHFATGQIHGYFDGEPEEEFFKLLALYIANFLLMIWKLHPITTDFGQNVTAKLAQNVLMWFDNMKNPVPTWYLKDFYI